LNNLSYVLFGLLIMVAIFLLGREIFCWYLKINERVRLLEKNNELLSNQNQLLSRLSKNTDKNLKLLSNFKNQKEENIHE